MKSKKLHIPAPGRGTGLQGFSLCGRWTKYDTGDHDLIRRQAWAAHNEGDTSYFCQDCMRRLLKGATQ